MRALVLSGGGSRGAWQAGVVFELLKSESRVYDLFAGVSVGALNAGYLAQFPTGDEALGAEQLKELWHSIETSSVREDWPGGLAQGLFETSFFSSEPLKKLVKKEFDQQRLQTSGKKLRIGACSLTTGEYRAFTEEDGYLEEAILASSAFPAMLESVRWFDHQWWTDGGCRTVVPLQDALTAGATEVDVVMCQRPGLPHWERDYQPSAISHATRALDIVMDQIVRDDLRSCGGAKVRVFQPSQSFEFGPLDFDPADMAAAFALGLEDGRKAPKILRG